MKYEMYSKARKTFNDNAADIKRLLEIHKDLGGDQRGRRRKLEVFNKAAIVLITSFWEAYCEDRAAEALEYIVRTAKNSEVLPKELKKKIADELKTDKNDIAIWKVADYGWKDLLTARLEVLKKERNRGLNFPTSENIDKLFLTSIGLKDISKSWGWNRMTSEKACSKLNKYVRLRGDIAHRGKASISCKKKDVKDYFDHIRKLVLYTDLKVTRFIVMLLHVKKTNNKL
jgi:hypothetical protein